MDFAMLIAHGQKNVQKRSLAYIIVQKSQEIRQQDTIIT